MNEKRDRKKAGRRMKHSTKISALQIFKFAVLSCVVIFAIQLLQGRDEKIVTSLIERVPLSKEGENLIPYTPESKKDQWLSVGENPLLTVDSRNGLAPEQRSLVKTSSGVKANILSRALESDEGSFEHLEERILSAPRLGAKIDAIEALTQSDDPDRATRVLSQALEIDRSAEIRLAALDALDEIDEVPFETLAQVAFNDPDPNLRLRALDLIGDGKERSERVAALLSRVAKADSSKEVRQSAAGLFDAMIRGR